MRKNVFTLLLGWFICIAVALGVAFAVIEGRHKHDYTQTVTDPTCTEQGFTTYTCECGDSYKENYIDARGHNYIDGKCDICDADHDCEYSTAVTDPTCTEQGFTTYTCTCGASYADEYTDSLGHSFKNGKCERCETDHDCEYTPTVTDPTCVEQGYTTYACECGASYTDDYEDSLGHSFKDGKCERCGTDHDCEYTSSVTKPNCTVSGFTTYTCECGASYTGGYVEPLGHNFVNGNCTRCGVEHDCEYISSVTDPTCTEQGFTTYTCECGANYIDDYTDPTGHDYTETVTDPTCTEQGFTTYTCHCGDSYIDDYTDPLGHDFVNGYCDICGTEHDCEYSSEVTDPTCTEQGFTTHTCTCGASYIDDYTDPTGHNYVEYVCLNCGEEVVRVESVSLDKDSLTIKKGNSETLKATVSPSNAYDKSIVWSSSDESIVTVEDGVITTLDYGVVTITATTADGNKTAECQVTVGEFKFTKILEDGEVVGYTVRGIRSLLDPDVVIPDSYKGKPVTSIGGSAFSSCHDIVSVQIPDSVTSIGTNAFIHCEKLTGIDIPDGVTTIGSGAFNFCESLTAIDIPDSVISIGIIAFYNCHAVKSIYVGKGLQSLKNRALVCGSLTKGSLVESIIVSEENEYFYSQNNCLIERESKTLIIGCNNSVIPDGITSIGNYAFYGCSDLTSINIPDSVTSIGIDAFYGCSGLTSITIPDGVTAIGSRAFQNCSSFTSINIPQSVTTIESYAFNGCGGLTSITVAEGNANYYSQGNCLIERESYSLIRGCNNSVIPDGVTSIGEYAFNNCSSLTSITIPQSVTYIGSCAFQGCSSLTSITIPQSVTYIGSDAFYRCSSLTSITIPDSVTFLGNYAFAYCESLTSITFSNGLTFIEFGTFRGCSGLTDIVIPDGITSIGNYAFEDCENLTSITIPVSVTSIGIDEFRDCSNLTSITFEGTKEEWKNIAKGTWWNYNTGRYTVHCTDGDLDKYKQ